MFDGKLSRVRAFTGPDAEQRAERVGNYFKALAGNPVAREWCIEKRVPITKATAENVDSTGGFLAPIEMDAAIIAIRESVGTFRMGADVRPAISDDRVTPRRSGGLTASFTPEGKAITESSFTLDAVEQVQKKAAILARASSELFSDSSASLGEFLTVEIAYAFAALEDDCGFNGDGTSVFGGISGLGPLLSGKKSSVAAAAGHNTFGGTTSAIDTVDIGNLVAAVLATAIPGAAWYISATGYGAAFCRLAAVGAGLAAFVKPDGTLIANYLGFPVRFSAKLPDVTSSLATKPMIFFGNLAQSSVLAERHSRTVIDLSVAERALDADQILIRGKSRFDIVNHTIGDATTKAPVACLVGTA